MRFSTYLKVGWKKDRVFGLPTARCTISLSLYQVPCLLQTIELRLLQTIFRIVTMVNYAKRDWSLVQARFLQQVFLRIYAMYASRLDLRCPDNCTKNFNLFDTVLKSRIAYLFKTRSLIHCLCIWSAAYLATIECPPMSTGPLPAFPILQHALICASPSPTVISQHPTLDWVMQLTQQFLVRWEHAPNVMIMHSRAWV